MIMPGKSPEELAVLAHGEKQNISIGKNIGQQKKGECLELIFKTPFNLQF